MDAQMIEFWLKAFDASMLEGRFFANRLVQLATTIASPTKWFTRILVFRIRQEEIHVLLAKFLYVQDNANDGRVAVVQDF